MSYTHVTSQIKVVMMENEGGSCNLVVVRRVTQNENGVMVPIPAQTIKGGENHCLR